MLGAFPAGLAFVSSRDRLAAVADDLYPDPTDEVPSEDRVRAMASQDARAVAKQLRESEQAEMPLTDDYPSTAFQLRWRSAASWPEPLKTIYLDAFKTHLDSENIAYRLRGGLSTPGLPAYVVDRKQD